MQSGPIGKNVALTRFFPRAAPASMGVSPEGVGAFVEAVQQQRIALHSFLLLRHGHVVAEAYWRPYGSELKHTLYSLSKSFTAVTVGIAIGQGLLSGDDQVCEILKDKVAGAASFNLEKMTIHDLLTMSAMP